MQKHADPAPSIQVPSQNMPAARVEQINNPVPVQQVNNAAPVQTVQNQVNAPQHQENAQQQVNNNQQPQKAQHPSANHI